MTKINTREDVQKAIQQLLQDAVVLSSSVENHPVITNVKAQIKGIEHYVNESRELKNLTLNNLLPMYENAKHIFTNIEHAVDFASNNTFTKSESTKNVVVKSKESKAKPTAKKVTKSKK
jgi:hypothetical protein